MIEWVQSVPPVISVRYGTVGTVPLFCSPPIILKPYFNTSTSAPRMSKCNTILDVPVITVRYLPNKNDVFSREVPTCHSHGTIKQTVTFFPVDIQKMVPVPTVPGTRYHRYLLNQCLLACFSKVNILNNLGYRYRIWLGVTSCVFDKIRSWIPIWHCIS